MSEEDPKKIFSVVNVDINRLGAPIDKFIDRISAAIGYVFKPHGIRAIAQAEADAAIIKNSADIEIQRQRLLAQHALSDLERRAAERLIKEEAQKQKNLERIVDATIPLIKEGAKPEELSPDWIANFFDKARLSSEAEMQAIWAALLAGQTNHPNRFSRRTVNLVASLDSKEARLFQKLFNFSLTSGNMLFPLMPNISDPIFTNNGLTFYDIQNLASMGLITVNDIAGFKVNKTAGACEFEYGGRKILIVVRDERGLQLGRVIFTEIGTQLASICETTFIPEFLDFVVKYWREGGNVVEVFPVSVGTS